MKTFIATVFAVVALAGTARAENVCGPTVCSVQPFCGNASLSAAQQHCLFPVAARYCEWRVCARNWWHMAWNWSVL